jgi:glycolate oxidase FAD binding subunit
MSIATMTAASRLASIAGPAQVVSDAAALAAYEVCGKRPAAAVRPGSSEEVAEIVKFAAAEKLAMVPCGARTKLSMGWAARQYDVALDMTRLDRVVAYDPADLTLSVEPGITLQKLAPVLAEHKQWLPLSVPYAGRATVGGTIASGVDTALRQMYGTARDYVLGMEFVTGQGTTAKSGGRVVKNVTGYDIHKLMIGALGTLGVMTKINFRTFPLPVAVRGFVSQFASAERALELRHSVGHSPLNPQALELFSPVAAKSLWSEAASRLVPEAARCDVPSKTHWTLAAEFSGNETVLDRCERDFREMTERCDGEGFVVFRKVEAAAVTALKREFIPVALESSPAATIVKMSLLPTRMREMLSSAAKAAETNSLRWMAMARGLGVIYFALLPGDRGDEARRRVIQATDQMLPECAALGGNATIPWSPAEWKSALKVWRLDRGDFDSMRKLKNLFDPIGILSPGRFLGGL